MGSGVADRVKKKKKQSIAQWNISVFNCLENCLKNDSKAKEKIVLSNSLNQWSIKSLGLAVFVLLFVHTN